MFTVGSLLSSPRFQHSYYYFDMEKLASFFSGKELAWVIGFQQARQIELIGTKNPSR